MGWAQHKEQVKSGNQMAHTLGVRFSLSNQETSYLLLREAHQCCSCKTFQGTEEQRGTPTPPLPDGTHEL